MKMASHQIEGLVSIIILSCDRPDYLRDAITSALQQTYRDIEVVVSDDASGPAVGDIVQSFDDARLRLLRHEERRGPAWNLDGALREARGEFVCCLDDDDEIYPAFVSTLKGALDRNSGAVLAFADQTIIDASGREVPEKTAELQQRWKRDVLPAGLLTDGAALGLIDKSIPVGSGSLFRYRAVASYAALPDMWNRQDMWLLYHALRDGGDVVYCPEPLGRYRFHSGSITSQRSSKKASTQVIVLEHLVGDDRLMAFRASLRRASGLARYSRGMAHLDEGARAAAARDFAAASIRGGTLRAPLALLLTALPHSLTVPFFRWFRETGASPKRSM